MSGFKLGFVIMSLIGVSAGLPDLTYDDDYRCIMSVGYGQEFAHETDCNKYYHCEGRNSTLLVCPDNLEWDNVAKICDIPERAGCRIPEYVKPCRDIAYPKCPVAHPNMETTNLGNPLDCGSFYTCVWCKVYLLICPKGLHFNSKLQICDSPERADCACL